MFRDSYFQQWIKHFWYFVTNQFSMTLLQMENVKWNGIKMAITVACPWTTYWIQYIIIQHNVG